MERYALLLSIALIAGCGDGKQDAADKMAEEAAADSTTAAVLDLSTYDTPLLITPPDAQLLGGAQATAAWNEEFGRVEVRAGEHFALNIAEGPGDLARLKADLERDMLRKHTIIKEAPDLLVYRSQFPDDAGVFVHFLRVVQVGGRIFEVTDHDEGRFTEEDVRRMLGSVAPKQPA
ncbi:MAG: hypothetical protein KA175_11920 [Flavobacteriales bacterium]|nr:hypothetical protein [Flavobacteriales bacterium]MBP6698319.1 hypothetical protein [Flavobacteriales bacterium]